MAASVFGYFVYIVTAFAAVMGLLIGCFDRSTLEVRRYPNPAVEIVSANKAEDRRLMSGGEERFVKNLPGKHDWMVNIELPHQARFINESPVRW